MKHDEDDLLQRSEALATQSFLKETSMPAYDIYVQCADCGGEHSLLMKIFLADGPERPQSLAEWFSGRSVPPQVSALKRHSALCLKTGKKSPLGSDDKVFLVPVGPFTGRPSSFDC
jgi:hypothetical protein